MALFVALGRFTEQGLKNIKEYPAIAHAVVQALPSEVKLIGPYVTQGRYDVVAVIECPSQEAALLLVAQMSAQGNTRWETMPAVTLDRFGELMAASVAQAGQPEVRLIEGERSERGAWKQS